MPAKVINFSDAPVYVDQDADDLALVVRCRAGETAAFEPIVERYQRVLYTVALRMLGNPEEARDVAQNAFIKAFRKLETFDPTRRFFSWIYRILVNECLNIRRAGRQSEPIPADMAGDDGHSPADLFESAERRRRVQAAILALPLEYREVVVLRHFADLPYEQIAETLGLPAKTVKSRLHTARARLAELLRGLDARI